MIFPKIEASSAEVLTKILKNLILSQRCTVNISKLFSNEKGRREFIKLNKFVYINTTMN